MPWAHSSDALRATHVFFLVDLAAPFHPSHARTQGRAGWFHPNGRKKTTTIILSSCSFNFGYLMRLSLSKRRARLLTLPCTYHLSRLLLQSRVGLVVWWCWCRMGGCVKVSFLKGNGIKRTWGGMCDGGTKIGWVGWPHLRSPRSIMSRLRASSDGRSKEKDGERTNQRTLVLHPVRPCACYSPTPLPAARPFCAGLSACKGGAWCAASCMAHLNRSLDVHHLNTKGHVPCLGGCSRHEQTLHKGCSRHDVSWL